LERWSPSVLSLPLPPIAYSSLFSSLLFSLSCSSSLHFGLFCHLGSPVLSSLFSLLSSLFSLSLAAQYPPSLSLQLAALVALAAQQQSTIINMDAFPQQAPQSHLSLYVLLTLTLSLSTTRDSPRSPLSSPTALRERSPNPRTSTSVVSPLVSQSTCSKRSLPSQVSPTAGEDGSAMEAGQRVKS
jgi:hypothetical protein